MLKEDKNNPDIELYLRQRLADLYKDYILAVDKAKIYIPEEGATTNQFDMTRSDLEETVLKLFDLVVIQSKIMELVNAYDSSFSNPGVDRIRELLKSYDLIPKFNNLYREMSRQVFK